MITPNELADLLETNYTRASVMEAVDVLRQQADTIYKHMELITQLREELEKTRQGMKDGFDGLETMTALSKAQADQITKLKLEWQYMYDRANMESTSKPVAWIDKDGEIFKAGQHPDYYEAKCTPLYTHPVKQLSDKEIEKVRVTIMETAYWCADENMPEAYNAIKVCCSKVLAILNGKQND